MTRAIVLIPALTARQAGRPRPVRVRTAAVLISWRAGTGAPAVRPAPGQPERPPSARGQQEHRKPRKEPPTR